MTYVHNMIGIPTHRVDLWHHGLRIGERNPKSLMEPPQGEERRRKKKKRDMASWWPSYAKGTGVIESRHVRWCDSCGVTHNT
jgi:hypothetical protein